MPRLSLSANDELVLTPLQEARAKLADPAPVREPVAKLLVSVSIAAAAALLLAATVILGAPTAGKRAGPLDQSGGARAPIGDRALQAEFALPEGC